MKEQVNRIAWLERQLAQVRTFIERDESLLKEDPDDFSIELSLISLKYEQEVLANELRLERKELIPDTLEIFFDKINGSPLSKKEREDTFKYLYEELLNAVLLSYAFRVDGRGPKKGHNTYIDKDRHFLCEIKENDKGRMLIFETGTGKTSSYKTLEHSILGILGTLNSISPDQIFENLLIIGLDCAIQLKKTLSSLDQAGLRLRLTWSAKDHVYFWNDDLFDDKAVERLAIAEHVTTKDMLITGSICESTDDLSLLVESKPSNEPIKLFCSDLQRTMILNTAKDRVVSIQTEEYLLNTSNELGRLRGLHAVT